MKRVRTGGITCVRHRADGDLAECVRVLARVHEHSGYPVNWPDRPGEWLTPAALLGAWVAELEGRVVGHVALCRGGASDLAPGVWSARTGADARATAVVGRLFVDPSARGHGIGALLMEAAAEGAQDRSLHPVLDVVATDTAARALYERLGWQLLTTVRQRWGPEQLVTVHCYAAAAP